MDVRGVLNQADVGPVVGELDLLDHDGGVTAHDVPGPGDALPENTVLWRIRPLVIVEHLDERDFECSFKFGQVDLSVTLTEAFTLR